MRVVFMSGRVLLAEHFPATTANASTPCAIAALCIHERS